MWLLMGSTVALCFCGGALSVELTEHGDNYLNGACPSPQTRASTQPCVARCRTRVGASAWCTADSEALVQQVRPP